jgi:hypothetical protein
MYLTFEISKESIFLMFAKTRFDINKIETIDNKA